MSLATSHFIHSPGAWSGGTCLWQVSIVDYQFILGLCQCVTYTLVGISPLGHSSCRTTRIVCRYFAEHFAELEWELYNMPESSFLILYIAKFVERQQRWFKPSWLPWAAASIIGPWPCSACLSSTPVIFRCGEHVSEKWFVKLGSCLSTDVGKALYYSNDSK